MLEVNTNANKCIIFINENGSEREIKHKEIVSRFGRSVYARIYRLSRTNKYVVFNEFPGIKFKSELQKIKLKISNEGSATIIEKNMEEKYLGGITYKQHPTRKEIGISACGKFINVITNKAFRVYKEKRIIAGRIYYSYKIMYKHLSATKLWADIFLEKISDECNHKVIYKDIENSVAFDVSKINWFLKETGLSTSINEKNRFIFDFKFGDKEILNIDGYRAASNMIDRSVGGNTYQKINGSDNARERNYYLYLAKRYVKLGYVYPQWMNIRCEDFLIRVRPANSGTV